MNNYIYNFKLCDFCSSADDLKEYASNTILTSQLLETEITLFEVTFNLFDYFSSNFYKRFQNSNIAYETIDIFKDKFELKLDSTYIWFVEKVKRLSTLTSIKDLGKSSTIKNFAQNPLNDVVNSEDILNAIENQDSTFINENPYYKLLTILQEKFINILEEYLKEYEDLFSDVYVDEKILYGIKEN